jgi:hypothetical protein
MTNIEKIFVNWVRKDFKVIKSFERIKRFNNKISYRITTEKECFISEYEGGEFLEIIISPEFLDDEDAIKILSDKLPANITCILVKREEFDNYLEFSLLDKLKMEWENIPFLEKDFETFEEFAICSSSYKKIFTRFCEDWRKNSNGGDYDFWFTSEEDGIHYHTSADFEYCDFCGNFSRNCNHEDEERDQLSFEEIENIVILENGLYCTRDCENR